ncbi:MAG: Biosynthetic peptidoglycan transglycosylase [Chlamydiia bacterium]|nr:Biosynthetic peptidoglycan transglycosylase [Chlamydiia bacterium]
MIAASVSNQSLHMRDKLSQKLKRLLFFLLRSFGILLVVFAVVSISQVLIYKWINPPFSNLMLLRKAEAYKKKDKSFNIDYRWVPYNKISKNLKKSILIAEDHEFFKHRGVIPYHVKLAYKHYVKRDKSIPPLHGYSTITQQTAKNVFLYPSKTLIRKGFEMYYALLMELIWGKTRILEVYLNIIECGDGIFGVEAASNRFYKKPAILVSRQQACVLAATLTSPRTLHTEAPSSYVLTRAKYFHKRLTMFPQEFKGFPL